MVKDGIGYRYAQECIREDNQDVGIYVKKQAKLWIDIVDDKDPDAIVDEKRYDRICRILHVIEHPDLHVPMDEGLEDYAWLFITAVLCTVCRDAPDTRFYITGLLEIARKNFKTFVSAVIFIILLLTEPDYSRYFSVAPDLALSNELKLAIRKIINQSPNLNIPEKAFKVLQKQIICKLNENEYTPLAYSQDDLDGKLANAFLADEAGNLDEYPVEAMRSSQITLKNKLGIIISTQYPNDSNVMITEIDVAKKTIDGLMSDRRYFALLYEPDSDITANEGWKDNDRVLYQANPVAVAHDYIMEDLKKKRELAILYENKRENFLCKHCNIRYKSLGTEAFIDIEKVKMCRRPRNDEWWQGRSVWIGLDLSMTDDNTSVAIATEEDGNIYARVYSFIPEARVDEKSHREHLDYKRFIQEGFCYSCGDEVIDYRFIEEFILKLKGELGVEIMQVGYDRWNALSTVQKLEAEELECVEIKQHSSVLHMPTKLLKEKILSREFVYDSNRLLEINFENAKCTEDTNLNKYVNKKKSTGKVDMVVSLINAVYLIQQNILFDDGFVVQVI